MQYKFNGNKMYLIAYDGYDRIKRRSRTKVVGSVNVGASELPKKLLDKLTPAEAAEAFTRLKSRQMSGLDALRNKGKELSARINRYMDQLERGDTPKDNLDAMEAEMADYFRSIESLTAKPAKSTLPR